MSFKLGALQCAGRGGCCWRAHPPPPRRTHTGTGASTLCRGTYDELLAGPTSREAGEAPPTLARDTASYTCQDARFELKKKEYERQYAQLYFYRLSQMRADVEAAARSAWPDIPGAQGKGSFVCGPCQRQRLPPQLPLLPSSSSPASAACGPSPPPSRPPACAPPAVSRISKLTEDEVEAEVAVVGTVYKEMALKPSILDEYVKDRALAQSLGEGAAGLVWRGLGGGWRGCL